MSTKLLQAIETSGGGPMRSRKLRIAAIAVLTFFVLPLSNQLVGTFYSSQKLPTPLIWIGGALVVATAVMLSVREDGQAEEVDFGPYRAPMIEAVRGRHVVPILAGLDERQIEDLETVPRLQFVRRLGSIRGADHPEGPRSVRQVAKLSTGRTVLLGPPGFGKTVTLALFCKHALEIADNGKAPVPVFVSLSAWTSTREGEDFTAWAGREISRRYRIASKAQVQDFIQAGNVALVLDGLDEVRADARGACLKSVVAYLKLRGSTRLTVLACRSEEFRSLMTQTSVGGVDVENVVELKGLTKEEIRTSLDEVSAWNSLVPASTNPIFEVLSAPLYLDLARSVDDPTVLLSLENLGAQREYLLRSYIEQRLRTPDRRLFAPSAARRLRFLTLLVNFLDSSRSDRMIFSESDLVETLREDRRSRPLVPLVGGGSLSMVFTMTGSLLALIATLTISDMTLRWTAVPTAFAAYLAGCFVSYSLGAPLSDVSEAGVFQRLAGWSAMLALAAVLVLLSGGTGRVADVGVAGISFVMAMAVCWRQLSWRVLALPYMRVHLSITGRLPIRLDGFLKWGAEAGLLRPAGDGYQFRHRELRGAVLAMDSP